jgi:hypothetical protein
VSLRSEDNNQLNTAESPARVKGADLEDTMAVTQLFY